MQQQGRMSDANRMQKQLHKRKQQHCARRRCTYIELVNKNSAAAE
jgi:hypothetical protein